MRFCNNCLLSTGSNVLLPRYKCHVTTSRWKPIPVFAYLPYITRLYVVHFEYDFQIKYPFKPQNICLKSMLRFFNGYITYSYIIGMKAMVA